jgi:uncharacterized HAD superfamily protein
VARVYVDLDDVLSQTIRGLLALLEREHGRRVREEEIRHFDLGRSFGLQPHELDDFMRAAHRPEHLEALEPSPGAAPALESWAADGHEVFVMTGRPPSAEAASRRWLDTHGIPHTRLACVDKYGRADWYETGGAALPLEALGELGFSLAVEDSLDVAVHLAEHCEVQVALMDRPWNRDAAGLSEHVSARIVRCRSWTELLQRFPEL